MDKNVKYVVIFLLSKAEYINHRKYHQRQSMHTDFSSGTDNVTCTTYNKICKSVSGLKRHTVVHKHQILQTDQIDLVWRRRPCYLAFASDFVDMQLD